MCCACSLGYLGWVRDWHRREANGDPTRSAVDIRFRPDDVDAGVGRLLPSVSGLCGRWATALMFVILERCRLGPELDLSRPVVTMQRRNAARRTIRSEVKRAKIEPALFLSQEQTP